LFKDIQDPKDLTATKADQELILLFNDLQDLKVANATKRIKDL
jgi:hypothetical protein